MGQSAHTPQSNSDGRVTVPVWTDGRLLGVLFVDSSIDLGRVAANESVQRAVSHHLHDAIAVMERAEAPTSNEKSDPAEVAEETLVIRNIGANSSLFMNGHYLIKGVAGAALWVLLRAYVAEGKTEFSARELRLEADIHLPDVHDNLGHRLAILLRRLASQSPHLYIEKIARGRFRMIVKKPVRLIEG